MGHAENDIIMIPRSCNWRLCKHADMAFTVID
jgi:hypothetical protein